MMNRRELICALAGAAAGCGIPRDPRHTLDRVRQYHTVRAGLSENPPCVIRTEGEPAGAEVELVRQFANELGAAPEWVWGGEQRHMEALQHFELNLLAAGLDSSTPWRKSVGITRPYFADRILVRIARFARQPERLDGMTVAVRFGDQAAAMFIKKHASPQRVAKLSRGGIAAAGPDWRLEQLGYVPTRFELLKRSHVMAVPSGENGWLKRLEEFLFQRQSAVRGLLQQEARKGMNAIAEEFDLPDDKRLTMRKAKRIVWVSIFFLLTTAVAVALTAGTSQTMKAMWIEDALSLVPCVSFLVGACYRKKSPDEAYPYGYRRAVLIGFLCGSVALFAFGVHLLGDSDSN